MAASKEEIAKALETLASGQTDAQHEHEQHAPQEASEPAQQLPHIDRVSRSIRPLPGKPGVPAERKPAAPQVSRGVLLRQTAIPPLLTLGVLMPIAGSTSLLMGEESPLTERPLVSVLLILLGLLILLSAALNMLHVKRLLSGRARSSER